MGEQPATTAAAATERPPRKGAARRRRVLIGDTRRNGNHLRTTWHGEDRVFVVSTWNREVCTGAIRVPVEDAAELAGLLVDGLADAATTPAPAASATGERSARRGTFRRELRIWLRQGRKVLRTLAGGRRRGRGSGRAAAGVAATLTTLAPPDDRRTA